MLPIEFDNRSEREERTRIDLLASLTRSPTVLARLTRSLPAKSTRWIVLTVRSSLHFEYETSVRDACRKGNVSTYETRRRNLVLELNETHGKDTVRPARFSVQLCVSDSTSFQAHGQ
jgi:hypothetical protein